MPFSITWDAAFLLTPAGASLIDSGDDRVRELKVALEERLKRCMNLAGDANDGLPYGALDTYFKSNTFTLSNGEAIVYTTLVTLTFTSPPTAGKMCLNTIFQAAQPTDAQSAAYHNFAWFVNTVEKRTLTSVFCQPYAYPVSLIHIEDTAISTLYTIELKYKRTSGGRKLNITDGYCYVALL